MDFTTQLEYASPIFKNILKFLLVQDPIKIASGVTLGFFLNNQLGEIIKQILKPIVYIIISLFSDTGFVYTLFGQPFDIGAVILAILTFFTFIVILYFCLLAPVDKLKEKYNVDKKTAQCKYCKTLINPDATRCPSCTSELNKPI